MGAEVMGLKRMVTRRRGIRNRGREGGRVKMCCIEMQKGKGRGERGRRESGVRRVGMGSRGGMGECRSGISWFASSGFCKGGARSSHKQPQKETEKRGVLNTQK